MVMQGSGRKTDGIPVYFSRSYIVEGSGPYGYGIRRLHQPPVFYLPGFDGNMFSRKGCIFGIGNRFPRKVQYVPGGHIGPVL